MSSSILLRRHPRSTRSVLLLLVSAQGSLGELQHHGSGVGLWCGGRDGATSRVSSLPSAVGVIPEPNGGRRLLLLCTPCSCSGLLRLLIRLLRCRPGRARVGAAEAVRAGVRAGAETCSLSSLLSLPRGRGVAALSFSMVVVRLRVVPVPTSEVVQPYGATTVTYLEGAH
jgi:hypothetical protein